MFSNVVTRMFINNVTETFAFQCFCKHCPNVQVCMFYKHFLKTLKKDISYNVPAECYSNVFFSCSKNVCL